MFGLYVGLEKFSCDMCGPGPKPKKVVTHKDGSKVEICDVCYGKCLAHPKFLVGVKSGEIVVTDY
jgi:ribosome-binding protein aMBF1 (putative translation factor)